MFIPLATDAPIYHRPVGTISIIVLNVLIFFLTLQSPWILETYGLVHGGGVHPLQWVTSNFIHGGFLHLLGNMIFLWGFGLLVEGKLGWRRFVPLYLGIGITECMLEELLLNQPGVVSYGASAVIYGLMAISLLWAPHNEVTVGYFFIFLLFVRFGTFELAIVWFSALTFLKSAVLTWFSGNPITELLHLLGAVIGAGVGLACLKWNWVDCEGWDLLSVLRGKTPATNTAMSYGYQLDEQRRATRKKAKRKTRTLKTSGEVDIDPLLKVSGLIEQQKPHAALAEIRKQRHLIPEWNPRTEDLLKLARLLRKCKEWKSAIKFYREYILKIPTDSQARLEAAEIMILVEDRPHAGRRILKLCDPADLSVKHQHHFERLINKADKLIEEGVIEMEGEAW